MKTRIFLTGAGGFVGSRIAAEYERKFDVIPCPRGVLRQTDEQAVRALIERAKPDIIIHTAAVSDMTSAQENPEISRRANVMLPEWLALAAKDARIKLICFSSDQVYNGCAGTGPFNENEPLSPVNVYGLQKLEAENRTLDILPSAVMLRATWMYDLPSFGLPIRGNLPMNLIRAALTGEPLHFSASDFRGVTYVREVARLMEPAFNLPGGTYNFGSGNRLSMYETAREFMRLLGLSEACGRVIIANDNKATHSLLMDDQRLGAYQIHFHDTCEGFACCLKDYGLINAQQYSRSV